MYLNPSTFCPAPSNKNDPGLPHYDLRHGSLPPAYLAIKALARFLKPRLYVLTTMLVNLRPSF